MLSRFQRRKGNSAWYNYIRFKSYLAIPIFPILLILTGIFVLVTFSCLYLGRLYEKVRGCNCSGSWFFSWPSHKDYNYNNKCPYHYGVLRAKEEFEISLGEGTDPRALLTSQNKYIRKYAKRHLKKCARQSVK